MRLAALLLFVLGPARAGDADPDQGFVEFDGSEAMILSDTGWLSGLAALATDCEMRRSLRKSLRMCWERWAST